MRITITVVFTFLVYVSSGWAQQKEPTQPERPSPTYSDIAYGEHERHVLDFYQAESEEPTPLVVYIHGGGFTNGSKEGIHVWTNAETLRQLLAAGISVASINYRYATIAPLPAAFYDSRRAIQFLRSKAADWNFDKERMGAFGGSAGAQICMWLAFHDEMADPGSADPVARESSRLAMVATGGGQTTMDLDWWRKWIPGYKSHRDRFETFGVTTQADLDEKIREVSALANISADDPPIHMVYHNSPDVAIPMIDQMSPDALIPEGTGPDGWTVNRWQVHNVMFGVKLKEKMDALGVEVDLKHPGTTSRYQTFEEFFIDKMGQSGFERTRIIGYSQVGQKGGGWFVAGGIFESILEDDEWELIWNGGAGVDKWRDPNYVGWSRDIVSPCPGDLPPDQILLSVSGPFGSDVNAWAEAIEDTLATIKQKYPSTRRIILQPVVGGPGGEPCPSPNPRPGRSIVRASAQHSFILEAIRQVVRNASNESVPVLEGFAPTIYDCSDFKDGLGHLTPAGAEAVAHEMATYYQFELGTP